MSSLTTSEKQKLESLLQMGTGYVLGFTNNSFQDFVQTSVGINIYDPTYYSTGSSKARLLRTFWKTESDKLVGKLLTDLLEHWMTDKLINSEAVTIGEQQLYDASLKIARRLQDTSAGRTNPRETAFLAQPIPEVDIARLKLAPDFQDVIQQRLEEINSCLEAKAPLAVIFLCGSTLEGLLSDHATSHPEQYNRAAKAPKEKSGSVRPIANWKLADLIVVSRELGVIGEDVSKFSAALKDFRNYIHPRQQIKEKFNPTMHTAEICYKVLQVAVIQIADATAEIAV